MKTLLKISTALSLAAGLSACGQMHPSEGMYSSPSHPYYYHANLEPDVANAHISYGSPYHFRKAKTWYEHNRSWPVGWRTAEAR